MDLLDEAVIKVEDNTNLVKKHFEMAIMRGLDAIGGAAETHAKEYAREKIYDQPQREGSTYIRTGNLWNSIAYQVKLAEREVWIGSRVKYAIYVELGTSRMAERSFLRPAAQYHSAEYKALIEDSLKNA